MEGNTDKIVNLLSAELASLPLKKLSTLCESIPAIKLYVSNNVHTELAKIIAG